MKQKDQKKVKLLDHLLEGETKVSKLLADLEYEKNRDIA